MKYLYYPGCSLEGTAREYDLSTRAIMRRVGLELVELEDWTCCGASAAASTSYMLSLALPARNLAIAEKMGDGMEILVPCSACYLSLKKVEEKIKKDPDLLASLNTILKAEGLQLSGKVMVRHLLDIIANDLGPEPIRSLVTKSLDGIGVAPYYGCQCLRPYAAFDDPECPQSMEPIIEAAGATVYPWNMGGKCCGASHMSTKTEVGIELTGTILSEAKGADVIVTVCPMCQMNLEAHQHKISRLHNEDLYRTILYLPQLIGLAFELSAEELGLGLNLSLTTNFDEKLRRAA
jgi:heterodisulfide reductase subunit B